MEIQDILGLTPSWLDMAKITGLAVLTLAVVQYLKTNIPDKLIRWFTLAVGICLAILSDLYVGKSVAWFQAIVNGIFAGVLSELGYQLLGKKAGVMTLPSKRDLSPPPGPTS